MTSSLRKVLAGVVSIDKPGVVIGGYGSRRFLLLMDRALARYKRETFHRMIISFPRDATGSRVSFSIRHFLLFHDRRERERTRREIFIDILRDRGTALYILGCAHKHWSGRSNIFPLFLLFRFHPHILSCFYIPLPSLLSLFPYSLHPDSSVATDLRGSKSS